MSDIFHACTLPWCIWPGGIQLTHSDSDVTPECSMEFGVMVVRPTYPYQELWAKVDFHEAAFASAKPHRDDEDVFDVSGYVLAGRPAGEQGRLGERMATIRG